MVIKYTVLRKGDKSDRGPNGEYGFCVVGKDEKTCYETAETVHCAEDHVHGPSCVKAQMNIKAVSGTDKDGKPIKEGLSPKAMIERKVRVHLASLRPSTDKSVFPKKKVTNPKTLKTTEVENLQVDL